MCGIVATPRCATLERVSPTPTCTQMLLAFVPATLSYDAPTWTGLVGASWTLNWLDCSSDTSSWLSA